MAGNIRSALTAGLIAFVAYTGISLLTGSKFGPAARAGLIYFVGTAIVTFIIILAVNAVRKNKTAA